MGLVSVNSEPWQIALMQSLVHVCNLLSAFEVLVHLQSKLILSQQQHDQIMAAQTDYRKNYQLVTWLIKQTYSTFDVFCEGLRTSAQGHIEKIITRDIVAVISSPSVVTSIPTETAEPEGNILKPQTTTLPVREGCSAEYALSSLSPQLVEDVLKSFEALLCGIGDRNQSVEIQAPPQDVLERIEAVLNGILARSQRVTKYLDVLVSLESLLSCFRDQNQGVELQRLVEDVLKSFGALLSGICDRNQSIEIQAPSQDVFERIEAVLNGIRARKQRVTIYLEVLDSLESLLSCFRDQNQEIELHQIIKAYEPIHEIRQLYDDLPKEIPVPEEQRYASEIRPVENVLEGFEALLNRVHERNIRVKIQAQKAYPKGLIVVAGGIVNEVTLHSDGSESYEVTLTDVCKAYDISSNRWDIDLPIPPLPTEREGLALVVKDGLLCALGGDNWTGEEIYNLEALSVEKKQWISGPIMSLKKRNGISAVVLEDNVFVVGGDININQPSILRMENNFVWIDVSTRNKCRIFYGAASMNGKMYCCGTDGSSDLCEEYDPSTTIIEQIEPPNHSGEGLKAVALKGSIFVIGGSDMGACERYDPNSKSKKWEIITYLPETVFNPVVATDGAQIFVIGGCTDLNDWGTAVDSVQIYDCEKMEWKYGARYPSKISSAGAAYVPSAVIFLNIQS